MHQSIRRIGTSYIRLLPADLPLRYDVRLQLLRKILKDHDYSLLEKLHEALIRQSMIYAGFTPAEIQDRISMEQQKHLN